MENKKIRILDILFVVLAVAFVFVVFKQKTSDKISSTGTDLLLTIEADEIERVSTEYVKSHDIVIDKRRNNTVGEVETVEVKSAIDNPSSEYKGVDDGREASENFKSLRLGVRANGHLNDDGIYINGFRYLLGEELTFTVGDLQVYAKLKAIEVKNEK